MGYELRVMLNVCTIVNLSVQTYMIDVVFPILQCFDGCDIH